MIRKARPDDLAAVESLDQSHASPDEKNILRFTPVWDAFLKDPNVCLMVAELENAICGYVLGFKQQPSYAAWRACWVENLLVDKSKRKLGLGKELMQGIEAWALAENCPQMALGSRAAADFYRAIGYRAAVTLFTKRLTNGIDKS